MRWPAGPPVPSFFLGHIGTFSRDELSFLDGIRGYGDFVPLRFGPRRAVLINHPALVEEVLVTHQRNFPKSPGYEVLKRLVGLGLVTSDGELWRHQRRLLQPAFHRSCIQRYAERMVARSRELADSWRGRTVIDVHDEMATLTLRIVSDCLFGVDITQEATRVGRLFTACMQQLNLMWNSIETFLPARMPTLGSRGLRRVLQGLDRLAYRIIERQRAGSASGDHLLALLVRAVDAGDAVTDRQLRDEIITLFFAGHETTAGALTWAWYLLARSPDDERRLQCELDAVLGERDPTIHDVEALRFTRAVFKESLRLYPPAPMLARQARESCELGGYPVRAGTIILVTQWLLHRDARFFEAPNEFRPRRWLEPSSDELPRFAYFPFSGGPRMCIGEAFALTEGTLALATLARRYRLSAADDRPIEPKMTLTLRPERPMWLALQPKRWQEQTAHDLAGAAV